METAILELTSDKHASTRPLLCLLLLLLLMLLLLLLLLMPAWGQGARAGSCISFGPYVPPYGLGVGLCGVLRGRSPFLHFGG